MIGLSRLSGAGSGGEEERGLLNGRKEIGLSAEASQSSAGVGRGSFSGGRACRRRRERISSGFGGGEASFLARRLCLRRSFSAVARERSFSREASSAWRELRRFFLSASGSMGLRPRSSAVVGSGDAGGGLCGPFLPGDGGGCWVGSSSWPGSAGRRGGCLRGDELLILSARALLRFGLLDGVLCIPDGGVLTTGSGRSGVGGSSGSGTTTSGSTPRGGDRRRPRRAKGLIASAASSGAGGGSGRGTGLGSALFAFGRLAGERRPLSSSPTLAPVF